MLKKRRGAASIWKSAIFVTIAVCSALNAGCASLPDLFPESLDTAVADARETATKDWNVTPALQVLPLDKPAVYHAGSPLPEAIAQREIEFSLPDNATVNDMLTLLSAIGISAITTSQELAGQPLGMTTFNGTLAELVNAMAFIRGIDFSWHDGVIGLSEGTVVTAYLPQNEELIKTVAQKLKSLGAEDVVASLNSASVSMRLPQGRMNQVKRYLDKVVGNASTVALQVAVVTVGLNKQRTTGLDWSRLQASLGKVAKAGLDLGTEGVGGIAGGGGGSAGDGGAAASSGSDSGGGSGGSGSSGTASGATGVGGVLKNSTLGLIAKDKDFSMQALFSLLSTYGKTQTTQNLILRTLSGGEVKIRSGSTVPYISGVSVNSNSNSGNLLGGTETETVETGLTLNIDPYYSARAGLVTMGIDLKLKTIVGFLKLDAGNQVGSLSRPEVQEQSLETVARAGTGDTVVLGGIIYNHLSDERNTLAGLEDVPIGHKDAQMKRNALFIIIRPTVITYQFNDNSPE